MSDALVSPAVAGAMGIVSASLLVVAARRVKRDNTTENLLPLMGVMGAFVFAAQMVNFAIPGTGSSGHLIGGLLLASLLGPWAGFVVLSSVVIVQCLLFGDGGLLALGCNIFNMAVCSCLLAYPLVFRPLAGQADVCSWVRLLIASIAASVVGLELGALAVVVQTWASGVTALPFARFALFMLPIHLPIAVGEGLATAALLSFLRSYRPELLRQSSTVNNRLAVRVLWVVLTVALLLTVGACFWASSLPDGLEWAMMNLGFGE